MGVTDVCFYKFRYSFWIINGISAIKHYLKNCVICIKRRAKSVAQLMGELPETRVALKSRLFSHVGIDYIGPITVSVGRRSEKR